MKEIGKLIGKTIVFTSLAAVVTILVSFALIFYLILPKVQSYRELSQENRAAADRLSLLSRNVASFEKLDKEENTAYSDIVKNFIPDQNDVLRFVVLNEIVASSSGVSISAIQVVTSAQS